jgi:hypothetical protein
MTDKEARKFVYRMASSIVWGQRHEDWTRNEPTGKEFTKEDRLLITSELRALANSLYELATEISGT